MADWYYEDDEDDAFPSVATNLYDSIDVSPPMIARSTTNSPGTTFAAAAAAKAPPSIAPSNVACTANIYASTESDAAIESFASYSSGLSDFDSTANYSSLPATEATRRLDSYNGEKTSSAAAISSAIEDQDYEEGVTTGEDCEEDNETTKNRTNSEAQGPKTVKTENENMFSKRWDAMFQLLIEYKAQHGNTQVPRSCGYDSAKPRLGNWVGEQKRKHSKNKLLQERVLRLESIGLVWSVEKFTSDEERWESMFQELLKYKLKHGHMIITSIEGAPKSQLVNWVQTQRKRHYNNKMSEARATRLESIGFEWHGLNERNIKADEKWEVMFQELLKYKAQHGHTLLSYRDRTQHSKLVNWVQTQRKLYNNKVLRSIRLVRLESVGFEWFGRKEQNIKHEEKWESMYRELVKFKARHGHMMVPPGDRTKTPQLVKWMQEQRRRYTNNRLPKRRILRLNGIGFVW